MDPAFIMYLDVALTAVMSGAERLWRGEELGKLCDHGSLFFFFFCTDCVNIVLIQKMEKIVKLSDLSCVALKSTNKHTVYFLKQNKSKTISV